MLLYRGALSKCLCSLLAPPKIKRMACVGLMQAQHGRQPQPSACPLLAISDVCRREPNKCARPTRAHRPLAALAPSRRRRPKRRGAARRGGPSLEVERSVRVIDDADAARRGGHSRHRRLREHTRLLVDLEEGDVVGRLVGDDEEVARRADLEVARRLAAAWHVCEEGEIASGFVDCQNRDGVILTASGRGQRGGGAGRGAATARRARGSAAEKAPAA